MDQFNFKKLILLIGFLNLNFAQAGGVHIGGGNAPALTPLSQEEIQTKIEYFHQFRHELITTLKLVGLSAKRVLAIQPQLSQALEQTEKAKSEFQAQLYDNIFTQTFDEKRVESIKINFDTDGACPDNLGNANDASVVNSDLNTICFSLNRLQEKLGKENYEVELMALYIHELSHCFGSTEQDGNALQEELRSLGLKFKDYLTFLNPEGIKIKNQLKEILAQVDALKLENTKISKICPQITSISSHIFSLFQSEGAKSTGQSALGFNGVIAFHAAYVVSSYLNDSCDPLMIIRKQIKFKKNKSLSVKDLYPDPTMILAPLGLDMQIKLSSYLFADLGDAVIVAPNFADINSLAVNLKEVKRLLELAVQ